MTESNRPSKASLYFGGDNFLAALNPVIDSGYAIVGVGTIDRRTILGQAGRTADGVDAGHTINAALRYAAQTDVIEANPEGYILLDRSDAKDVWCIPARLAGITTVTPAAGIVTRVASFVQADRGAVAATKRIGVGSGTMTVAAGDQVYMVRLSGSAKMNLTQGGTSRANIPAAKGQGIYPASVAANAGYSFTGSGTTGLAIAGAELVAEGS